MEMSVQVRPGWVRLGSDRMMNAKRCGRHLGPLLSVGTALLYCPPSSRYIAASTTCYYNIYISKRYSRVFLCDPASHNVFLAIKSRIDKDSSR